MAKKLKQSKEQTIQGIAYDITLGQDGIFYIGVQRTSQSKGKKWVPVPSEMKPQLVELIHNLSKAAAASDSLDTAGSSSDS
jgi:hypothetical protein